MTTKRKRTPNPEGRYVNAWAEVRHEDARLWVEKGEDAQAVVDHWFQWGDVVGYGFTEIENDDNED